MSSYDGLFVLLQVFYSFISRLDFDFYAVCHGHGLALFSHVYEFVLTFLKLKVSFDRMI